MTEQTDRQTEHITVKDKLNSKSTTVHKTKKIQQQQKLCKLKLNVS